MPSVTSLGTTSGASGGGTSVSITGTNFSEVTGLYFGDFPARDFTVNSTTSITALAPPEAAGTVDVTVLNAAGRSPPSSSTRYTYMAVPAPAITSLSTNSGSTNGGAVLTITGTNLTGATQVFFGEVPADFTVLSDTTILATAPAQAAGTVDVTVETMSGTLVLSSSDHFTYSAGSAPTVTSLSVTSGSTAGGTAVTITGTNFSGVTGVSFASVTADDFTIISDTKIVATTPAQAAGTVHVTVTTYSGTSSTSSSDQFTYSAASAPTVTGVAPSSGSTAGDDRVTISGTNFTGATGVSFGGIAADFFEVVSATSIVAWSPAAAAGTVDITVTTYGGTSSTSTADQFTYSAPSAPSISGISPSSGSTAGGDVVTITGSNLAGVTAVYFGHASAQDFTINSDGQLTATAPAHTAGTWDITVVSAGGTSALGSADRYTFSAASTPAVNSLSPTSGSTAGGASVTITGTNFTGAWRVPTPAGQSATGTADQFTYLSTGVPTITSLGTSTGTTAGGTSVSITGTNFTGATAVMFGSVAAASYTVNSSTSITATSPAQAAGMVDITVTTASGTSAAVSADHFTYTAASLPTVTSLGTSSGSTAGGTSVAITGTNFTGAIAVYFGDVPAASFTVNSSTSITATSPAQAVGTVDVTVETYSGTSAAGSGDRYSYTLASAPAVTSLGTTSGSTAGGTSVTITGTDFTGATAVYFGAEPAADFTVNSSTSITATSPAQAAGMVDVTVWTPSGSSAASRSDHFTYVSLPITLASFSA